MSLSRSFPKFLLKLFACLLVLALVLVIWFNARISLSAPQVAGIRVDTVRVRVAPDYYRIGHNWLRKNRHGLWEMYLEGSPYERGVIYGQLARELVNDQENVFVEQIRSMIPNASVLNWLKYFVGWFNRDIDRYIPQENLEEIYGISQSFSDSFNFIGKPYYRVLNYHAAHDIGHALTDLNMVGCTSFAVNKELSADSSLIIGRNFDFNMGDGFARNKLMLFMKPDEGYAFASVGWAGFTGVVSGMNEKGLTITLNASKSDIPYKAKTPISILAREILQYAGSIGEAVAIAGKRETFVSESLLVGSAAEDKAVIIEKTPSRMDVYDSGTALTVCSNHYQGSALGSEKTNLENLENSDSGYRFNRMRELIGNSVPLDLKNSVSILRNTLGAHDEFIGYGNPKSINQLLAHHGIIFKPGERRLWVSANPYQLGVFVGYDLKKVFSPVPFPTDSSLVLPADPFLATQDYRNFEEFKKTANDIRKYLMTGQSFSFSDAEERRFISNNPESYLPYLLLGDYYKKREDCGKALTYYRSALGKELPSAYEETAIRDKIEKCR
ncbi:MAG: peptidase C45 [Cytophagaceae bacterium SCN 52-12]|nr:MAG: peptidase C45 [Cytophagaceae bacterium SCN 52-12]